MTAPIRPAFSYCLSCSLPFEANDFLEHLPLGRRIAFDPERGRLWVICRRCRRWTLTPIESRWEAIDELERALTVTDGGRGDRPRLLATSDRISLFRAGPISIVRVGTTVLEEEAWWRFGQTLSNRRRSVIVSIGGGAAIAAGTVAFGGVLTAAGLGTLGYGGVLTAVQLASHFTGGRWVRATQRLALQRRAPCRRCGREMPRGSVPSFDRSYVTAAGSDWEIAALGMRCYKCGGAEESGYRVRGGEERYLRTMLTGLNWAGSTRKGVRAAISLLDQRGGPKRYLSELVDSRTPLADLSKPERLAIEVALSDESEARDLREEVVILERQWMIEEELASIIDDELTWV